MKRGLKIGLIVLFFSGAMLAAWFYFQPKKALRIILPDFRNIKSLYVNLMEDTARITADVLFENKSVFKLNVDSFIYRVKLDTLTILSERKDLDLQIRPSEADTIQLPLNLPFKRISQEIKDLQSRDSVGISFDLRLVYSTWLGKAVLPYKKTITVAVPVPPQFEVLKLEYKDRSKNKFRFNAQVKVINKGKLDLHLSDIRYNLVVRDNLRASGKDASEIHVKPGSEVTVTLPIEVEFDHLLKTLVDVATNNDQVSYHLKITARAGIDKLSKEKTDVLVEKKGITELKR